MKSWLKTRNGFYITIILACLAGFTWLFINQIYMKSTQGISACLFKEVTTLPCPACGSTRAILTIFDGQIISGILLNPNGLILLGIMTIVPGWILYDFLSRKSSFLNFYKRLETLVKNNRSIGILFIVLIIANWIWNVIKGL